MNILLLADRNRPSTKLIESCLIGSGNNVTIHGSEPEENVFLEYDLGISWYYYHTLREEHIDAFYIGAINCHSSYLPYNRGAYPNVWPIFDNTPAGVAIHWISKGIDEGDILARERVEVLSTDTAFTLYNRLESEMVRMFLEFWPEFQEGGIHTGIGISQEELPETPTKHFKKELEEARSLESSFADSELEAVKRAIEIMRATTFPGYNGAYFLDENGEKVYIEVNLYR